MLVEAEILLPDDMLRALVDSLSQGVILMDENNRVLYWNNWVAHWTGIQCDDARGEALTTLFPGLSVGGLGDYLAVFRGEDINLAWKRPTDTANLRQVNQAMVGGASGFTLQQLLCRSLRVAGKYWCLIELATTETESSGSIGSASASANPQQDGPVSINLESDRFGILSIDRYGFIRRINTAMTELVGYSEVDLHDKPVRILFPDFPNDEGGESLRAQLEARQHRHPDHYLEIVTADGGILQLDAQLFDNVDNSGSVTLMCRDMTRSVGIQDALFRQREHLSAIYTQVTDAILLVDRRGYLENSNPVASELLSLGYRRNSEIFVDELLRLKDAEDNWVYPFSLAMSRERTVSLTDNIRLIVSGGAPVPVFVTATPVRDRGNRITGCVIVMRSVSESRRVSTRLSWHETHDPLTQLANRRQIENEIVRAIDSAHVDDCTHVFLYIDLYNFSVINETCGHSAGDEMLRQFAHMMSQEVGDQDVVARLGNDEFALLLWNREPSLVRDEVEDILRNHRVQHCLGRSSTQGGGQYWRAQH